MWFSLWKSSPSQLSFYPHHQKIRLMARTGHYTCVPFTSELCKQICGSRQWLRNHTNTCTLPLLAAPAEPPLLKNSQGCLNMDVPAHLPQTPLCWYCLAFYSPLCLSLCHCLSCQLSVSSLCAFLPLPAIHHWALNIQQLKLITAVNTG